MDDTSHTINSLTRERVAALKAIVDAMFAHADESGSFTWDTSEFSTNEIDISALFKTPLTGTKRRRYSVFIDITEMVADVAEWTKLTVNVKVKVDGRNYRTVDQKEIAKADAAVDKEPGIPIDIIAVAEDVQITFELDAALNGDATVYYGTVKEALE